MSIQNTLKEQDRMGSIFLSAKQPQIIANSLSAKEQANLERVFNTVTMTRTDIINTNLNSAKNFVQNSIINAVEENNAKNKKKTTNSSTTANAFYDNKTDVTNLTNVKKTTKEASSTKKKTGSTKKSTGKKKKTSSGSSSRSKNKVTKKELQRYLNQLNYNETLSQLFSTLNLVQTGKSYSDTNLQMQVTNVREELLRRQMNGTLQIMSGTEFGLARDLQARKYLTTRIQSINGKISPFVVENVKSAEADKHADAFNISAELQEQYDINKFADELAPLLEKTIGGSL